LCGMPLILVLQMDAEEARALSKDIKVTKQTFNIAANAMREIGESIKPVRRLVGAKDGGVGSKLIAAGAACIAFPEPLFSDVIGLALLTAGLIINGGRNLTVIYVLREYRKVETELRRSISSLILI